VSRPARGVPRPPPDEPPTVPGAPVASLDAFFRPKRVAVVGASDTPGKWGYLVLRTLADGGYAGEVAAVNGRGGEVQGRPAFATVADLPSA
jgi:acyl-CoA synthetase (NDP forming)